MADQEILNMMESILEGKMKKKQYEKDCECENDDCDCEEMDEGDYSDDESMNEELASILSEAKLSKAVKRQISSFYMDEVKMLVQKYKSKIEAEVKHSIYSSEDQSALKSEMFKTFALALKTASSDLGKMK